LVKPIERRLVAVAFPFLVAGAFFTPQLVTRSASIEAFDVHGSSFATSRPANDEWQITSEWPTVPPSPDSLAARGSTDARDEQGDHADADGYTDLYGNEVTDAVATYTFDQTGSLYELHSPQTELLRLGIPKS
jgi:hypothetical protein